MPCTRVWVGGKSTGTLVIIIINQVSISNEAGAYNLVNMLDYVRRGNLGVGLKQMADLWVDMFNIGIVPFLVTVCIHP